jgi:hypothetical protein
MFIQLIITFCLINQLKGIIPKTNEIKNTLLLKNNKEYTLDYNKFNLYGTDFNRIILHCDRYNFFWVFNSKKKCRNTWDTTDVSICKNNVLINDSNAKGRFNDLSPLANTDKKIYKCLCDNKCIKLPIGVRAKHFYEDDKYSIYNERDYGGNLFKHNGMGRLIFKTNETEYNSKFFDIHNKNTKNGGSEDYRYIIFNNELYVVMNGVPNKSKIRQMYLYNIEKDEICQLYIKNYDVSHIFQKNWTPYVYKNDLYFIYSFCELCVIKLKNYKTGECELIYGDPSKFINENIFGGTNLCYWKKNLFIGFAHTRKPYYSIPIIFDAENFKYISISTPIKIKPPFNINLSPNKIVQYPYYLRKNKNIYELSVCHQDFYSIKYDIEESKIENIFNNLLNNQYLSSIKTGSSNTNNKVINNTY